MDHLTSNHRVRTSNHPHFCLLVALSEFGIFFVCFLKMKKCAHAVSELIHY